MSIAYRRVKNYLYGKAISVDNQNQIKQNTPDDSNKKNFYLEKT